MESHPRRLAYSYIGCAMSAAGLLLHRHGLNIGTCNCKNDMGTCFCPSTSVFLQPPVQWTWGVSWGKVAGLWG
jgi:hypothetical protein